MTNKEEPQTGGTARVDLGRVGDWTTWTSLLVLLTLLPLTFLCLAPFALVLSLLLPVPFEFWFVVYFAMFVLVLIPGLEFISVWIVSRHSRKPTPDEMARLTPLWERVLSRVGKGKRRRYKLRVEDDYRVNAAAGGGNLVIVTTHALDGLPDDQLEAVLAHELGHHVGFHPIMLLLQRWLILPVSWVAALSVLIHNFVAWLTSLELSSIAPRAAWIAIIFIRAMLLVLDAIVRLATLVLLFLGRRAEHSADAVSTKLGYGTPLIAALERMHKEYEAQLANTSEPYPVRTFWNTHPPVPNRIAKIQKKMNQATP